jgi:hypothetical protein
MRLPCRCESPGAAKSDDRGMFRIPGLGPGRYYVRTGTHELEDGQALLPTFAQETASASEARVFPTELDVEVQEISIFPLPGRLGSVSGQLTGCMEATVTLTSDTGSQQTRVPCQPPGFSFTALSPGYYELLAEAGEGESRLAAHLEVHIAGDVRGVNLALRPVPSVRIDVRQTGGGLIRDEGVTILARRKELSGEGETIRLERPSERLVPGFWEVAALPESSSYLSAISLRFDLRRRSRAGQNPDWYELYVENSAYSSLTVTVSPRPATLNGKVTSGTKPVAGAPVFMLPITPETRRRMNGVRTVRSDPEGIYRFGGLAPGDYLLLSSFDFAEVDEALLTNARALLVRFTEGTAESRDLELYTVP